MRFKILAHRRSWRCALRIPLHHWPSQMPGQSRKVKVLFLDKFVGSDVLRHWPCRNVHFRPIRSQGIYYKHNLLLTHAWTNIIIIYSRCQEIWDPNNFQIFQISSETPSGYGWISVGCCGRVGWIDIWTRISNTCRYGGGRGAILYSHYTLDKVGYM